MYGWGIFQHGTPSFRINDESQRRGKTNSAKQTQLILGKAFGRSTYGTQHFCIEILASPHEIKNRVVDRIIKESVDRKVPPSRITLGIGKIDSLRMPSVMIGAITTE